MKLQNLTCLIISGNTVVVGASYNGTFGSVNIFETRNDSGINNWEQALSSYLIVGFHEEDKVGYHNILNTCDQITFNDHSGKSACHLWFGIFYKVELTMKDL